MDDKSVRALFVHQGYELYGSDRSFLQSILAFRKTFPDSHITAIIPRNGALYPELKKVADVALIEPLFIARGAEAAKFFLTAPVLLPIALLRAWGHLHKADFLYINTVKVIDYMMIARLTRKPVMIHLREIYETKMGKLLEKLVLFSKAEMVFNSYATAESFSAKKLAHPIVVHNGVPTLKNIKAPQASNTLNILFLGRFNDWKGQDTLVEAIGRMPEKDRAHVSVRLIGDVFGNQVQYKTQLNELIQRFKLQGKVVLETFLPDVSDALSWAHVLVVPSKKPEPFGRVAAEGLAAGRVVVASNHGGLPEIVENGKSGFLFTPGKADELAAILSHLINSNTDLTTISKNARKRHASHFSEEIYMQKMGGLFKLMLHR